MKTPILLLAAIAMLMACNNQQEATSAADSSNVKEEAWVPVDSATYMQKMTEYATPGEMHKLLASWSGNWDGEMTMWNYEGATPETFKIAGNSSMILDGKYQVTKYTGNIMGMPFEGISTIAYDNALGKFVSSWIDNFGSGMTITNGEWNAASQTLASTGSRPDVFRPGKMVNTRETYQVVDANTHLMEMFEPDPQTGKEYKMMAIKLTRKK